jgi:hypothetical protein
MNSFFFNNNIGLCVLVCGIGLFSVVRYRKEEERLLIWCIVLDFIALLELDLGKGHSRVYMVEERCMVGCGCGMARMAGGQGCCQHTNLIEMFIADNNISHEIPFENRPTKIHMLRLYGDGFYSRNNKIYLIAIIFFRFLVFGENLLSNQTLFRPITMELKSIFFQKTTAVN